LFTVGEQSLPEKKPFEKKSKMLQTFGGKPKKNNRTRISRMLQCNFFNFQFVFQHGFSSSDFFFKDVVLTHLHFRKL